MVKPGCNCCRVLLFCALAISNAAALCGGESPAAGGGPAITPRSEDFDEVALEQLTPAGIRVTLLGSYRWRGVTRRPPWLLVPEGMRYRKVGARELVDAVAAAHGYRVLWTRKGRCAVVYRGASDTRVNAVKAGLKSEKPEGRRLAAWRAGWVEDVRVISPLVAVAVGDKDREVRRRARISLRRIGWGAALAVEPERAWPLAKEACDSTYTLSCRGAFAGIGEVCGPEARPFLKEKAGSKTKAVGNAARQALATMAGKDLLKQIVGSRRKPDPQAALTLLERGGSPGRMELIRALDDVWLLGGERSAAAVIKTLKKYPRLSFKQAGAGGIGAMLERDHIRSSALEALGRIGGKAALAHLQGELKSEIPATYTHAMRAVARSGSREAIEILGREVCSEDIARSSTAASLLGYIGHPDGLAFLAKALDRHAKNDKARTLCRAAAKAVNRIGGEKALPIQRRSLEVRSNEVVTVALEALGRSGDEKSIALVEKRLSGGYSSEAAMALGLLGSARAFELLTKQLESTDLRARRGACCGLGRIGGKRADQLLEKALCDPKRSEGAVAAWALGLEGDPARLPMLVKAMRSSSESVRHSAVIALDKYHGKEARRLLDDATIDPSDKVERSAKSAMRFR